jgi:hypothetical protein
MIDLGQDERAFVCDRCSGRASFVEDRLSAWHRLHDKGWVAMKDSEGEWCHLCPDCRKPSKGSILDTPASKVSRYG